MKKLKKVKSIDIPQIDQVLSTLSMENKQYIEKSMAIAEQIHCLLNEQDLFQKDFAALLDKSEAEVSKICSGTQNFTIRSIGRMESILHHDIILTPLQIYPRNRFFCAHMIYRTFVGVSQETNQEREQKHYRYLQAI